jgi:hypothetical protein
MQWAFCQSRYLGIRQQPERVPRIAQAFHQSLALGNWLDVAICGSDESATIQIYLLNDAHRAATSRCFQ